VSAELPQPFGRYVLTRLIGEGGMAEVYQASVRVAEGLTKWVVIKKIRKEFADEREFTRMFVEEAKIALGLNHANIVQVFDFGQVRGTFYLAMELIEGLDLMRLFHAARAQGDAFPAVIAAYVAHQVASGLAYAHRRRDDYGAPLGIVHRDVSPHNIMLSYDGQVKILDFGIARARGPASRPSASAAEEETIKGKVAYMSPEQALGRPLDQRSDIYSLGVVLYELLTGELLFRQRDRIAALARVRSDPLQPVLEVAPDLPDELAAIVDRALARDPNARYATARELQAELAAFLHRADPVVDDEALRQFLGRYRPKDPRAAARPGAIEHGATRDMGDSQVPGPGRGPNRRSQRAILLHAAFAPQRPLPGAPAPDPTPVLEIVRNIAFKRDAHVHRLDLDAAVLAFGTLVPSGDDPERALRVALALREAVGEAAPGVGLGLALVDTHVAVVRAEDGAELVDLPPGLGAALDRVARRAIDDHIVVAGELVERLGRAWRVGPTDLSDIALDEHSAGTPWAAELQQLAPLLGPLSEAERRAHQPAFGRALLVGRELELKSLRDAFAEAIRSGETRSVIVVGEPGFGKRALLERFVASLPRGSCTILRGVGLWSHRNRPFGVFLEVLQRFLRLDPDTPLADVERRLADYGVREADKLAHALAHALGLPGGDAERLDPLERRDRLWRLVRRLIRALAQRRPVLIVLENLHFLDTESLRVLEEWTEIRHPLPILGITTSRPGPRAEALAGRPLVHIVELRELDEHARRELVLRRFEDPEDAAGLADAILARTGGNPLFIEEILASLLHRGVLGWNAQGRYLVVREPNAGIELPPGVGEALQARIDVLAAEEREAVLAAAVLGRSFRPAELADLLDANPRRQLQALIDSGVLEREATGAGDDDGALRFATVSLHEVCKSAVAPGRLEQLHGRVAEIKLARADYTPGRDDGPIAEHLVQAGRLAEAVDPALRAARDALDTASSVEAYYFLTQALKAMSADDPRRFEVLLEREPLLRAWGRRRAQGADIRQLLRLAAADDDPELEVVASARLLRFYLECGRTQRATQLVPRLADRIRALPRPEPHLSMLGELRSDLFFARGQFDEAEEAARSALPYCWGDRDGVSRRCRLLACIGRVQLGTGRRPLAEETFREVLELARSIGHRRREAEALNALGEVAGRSARYQEAVDHFKAALAIDHDLGDRFATGTKLANLGITYTAIGLYRRAERYLRKALELHEAIGHPGLLNDVMVNLGEVVAELGDPVGARTLLEDAAAVAGRRGDVRTELRARLKLAGLLVGAGSDAELEEAERIAGSALEDARREGLRSARVRALHVLARCAVRRGRPAEAITAEREAVTLIQAGAAPLDGVLSIHHLGRLLREAGDVGAGDRLLRDAAARVQERLASLRDPELRGGYERQPSVRQVLEDGGRVAG
jgi:serine/threonine protein kinase/tetratricopeptide (TPR) repeat protein